MHVPEHDYFHYSIGNPYESRNLLTLVSKNRHTVQDQRKVQNFILHVTFLKILYGQSIFFYLFVILKVIEFLFEQSEKLKAVKPEGYELHKKKILDFHNFKARYSIEL